MAIVISAPDALRQSVEAASGGKNTVLYDAKGYPSIMYVRPKFNLQDVDAGLGTGVHPAFVVNGVEKSEVFVGKFPCIVHDGNALSLPGHDPKTSVTFDQSLAYCAAKGAGWHLMTRAEWMALIYPEWKAGFQPRGNNDYGRDAANTWETGRRSDGLAPGYTTSGGRTLTGSGPASWHHDGTPFGVSDLNGNVWGWVGGMRVNAGEINILANNNAADNTKDQTAGSAEWKAIDGATGALVAPGTAGTVKYATSGTANYTLVRVSGSSFEGMTNPGGTPVGDTALSLCKALGLYPVAGSGLGGDGFWFDATDERLPWCGGYFYNAADAGVSALALNGLRSSASSLLGFWLACVL